MEHLKGLTNLVNIYLSSTQVSDAGLEHLKGLTNLVRLELKMTNVAATGIVDLQKALPNCKIDWDGAK